MRYYVAYGSNLNKSQMKWRCPKAEAVGTATIKGWRLNFRGSKTGSYLTIEPDKRGRVPVAIWRVTKDDENALDRYEGFPTFYYKQGMQLDVTINDGSVRTLNTFVYIMREDAPEGVPTFLYMDTCMEGYSDFGFNNDYLWKAYSYVTRKLA